MPSRNAVRNAVNRMLNSGVGLPSSISLPGTLDVTGAATAASVTAPTLAADTLQEKTSNRGVAFSSPVRKSILSTTASGNIVLTAASAPVQRIDANGSHRDVTLPTLTGSNENGLEFELQNTSGTAVNLVVKNSGGSTIVTINQGEKATVKVESGSWVHTGVLAAALS